MSSRSGPHHAACRLHLSDTFLHLEGPDGLDERIDCGRDAEGLSEALRMLAGRCRGPVVAVLPSEAFAIIEPRPGWRAAVMGRFGTRHLAVAAGRREGCVHLVGVPRGVLRECGTFLAAAGFTLAGVEPEAALLPGGHVPVFPVRAPGVRPFLPPPAPGFGKRAGGWRGVLVPVAGAVVVAMLGLGLVAPGAVDAPAVTEAAPPPESDDAEVAAMVAPMPPSEAQAAPHPLAELAAPEITTAITVPEAARPRDRPRLALLVSDPPRSRAPAPLPEAVAEQPAMVRMSRSVPPEVREAMLAADARAAGESYPRVTVLGPVPRPVTVAPGAEASAAGLRPLARPGAAAAVPDAADSALARPLPRPGAGDDAARIAEAVAAALEIAAADASGGSAAAGMRPEPRGVASPMPVPVRSSEPARANPPATAMAVPQQQVVRVQPQQQQAAARSFAPQAARGSGELTLVGVFGTSSRRHALVLLPGGTVQRVRPGETVNGVEIAAVGEDSVRVRINGRDGVLRLPD